MSGKLKEVRVRIKSVQSTQQITKAMKMVAAAKLRKAQTAIQQMRPYAKKLNEVLSNIVSNVEGEVEVAYGKERPVNSAAVVVMTSDRGLCGAFNSNVIKAAKAVIDGKYANLRESGDVSIICVGKRSYDFFKKRYSDCNVINDYVNYIKSPTFLQAEEIATHLMESFDLGVYDEVYVAYGEFRNAVVQNPKCDQYLPIQKVEKQEGESNLRADFIFEPTTDELLKNMFPTILKTQIFRYMLDTAASEHGARMTAMDNATENAEELIKDLKIAYNKARQEAITKEISEIVGGAAALEG